MAQRVKIELVDDIDGSAAVETVSFAIDGKSYEVDLNEANAAKLREAVAPFVGVGRRVGAARRGPAARSSAGGPTPQDLRAWARDNGYQVSDRGRVSEEIRQAYAAAH